MVLCLLSELRFIYRDVCFDAKYSILNPLFLDHSGLTHKISIHLTMLHRKVPVSELAHEGNVPLKSRPYLAHHDQAGVRHGSHSHHLPDRYQLNSEFWRYFEAEKRKTLFRLIPRKRRRTGSCGNWWIGISDNWETVWNLLQIRLRIGIVSSFLRGIFGRSFSDSAVTKQQDGKMRPNKLKTDSESAWICCQFSEKAKRNVHQPTAHSVLLFVVDSKGGKHPPWPEESKETGGFVAHYFACKV